MRPRSLQGHKAANVVGEILKTDLGLRARGRIERTRRPPGAFSWALNTCSIRARTLLFARFAVRLDLRQADDSVARVCGYGLFEARASASAPYRPNGRRCRAFTSLEVFALFKRSSSF